MGLNELLHNIKALLFYELKKKITNYKFHWCFESP